MEGWNEGQKSPMVQAVEGLLTSLEQNNAAYLGGTMERDKYLEEMRAIDDRLAVAGLRLAARPWERR
jgi:hypothetical protein